MDAGYLLQLGALSALCALAVAHDLLFRRIPNGLVLAGIALGILFQIVSPAVAELSQSARIGFGGALLGALVGLAAFLPFYALRAMGAGDVKMLAMVGVWVGPVSIAWVALWTLLAGGVLALMAAMWSGVLRHVLSNMVTMVASTMRRAQGMSQAEAHAPAGTTGALPYAVAIAFGTVVELIRLRLSIGT
jgi:prepilin peptidase CpaA